MASKQLRGVLVLAAICSGYIVVSAQNNTTVTTDSNSPRSTTFEYTTPEPSSTSPEASNITVTTAEENLTTIMLSTTVTGTDLYSDTEDTVTLHTSISTPTRLNGIDFYSTTEGKVTSNTSESATTAVERTNFYLTTKATTNVTDDVTDGGSGKDITTDTPSSTTFTTTTNLETKTMTSAEVNVSRTTTVSSSSQSTTTSITITAESLETTSAETKTTRLFTTTTTRTPSISTTQADNVPIKVILPICLVLFGIVAIIFIVVLYFYCTGRELPFVGRRRGQHEIIEIPPRKPSNAPKFAVGHMAINNSEFEAQFKRKIADDGRGFREEFRAVHTDSGTLEVSRDPVNVARNRYDNVLPWDSTRVVLSTPSNGHQVDDYINANFVPGYLQEKKFIACQGPKENTCDDFWRMIWDQNCATIVMVTNLIEAKKIKCHQYWPGEDTGASEPEKYGEFLVTVVDIKLRNYYIVRTLKLQLLNYPARMISQFHYTAWPDFGVPRNPHELLLFRRRVIAANPPHSGPIVVHCSAGVGRTGTYILIDAAMEELQAEGKVDLYSFLTKMRKYRMMLVQTDAQYIFAHAAILEHIKYGDTEIGVKKFRAQVQSLREPVEGFEESLLEEQFSGLVKIQMNKENMKHGRQSIKKNRVLQIIPYDNNRVTLPLKPGQERSDYINASFIDGSQEKRSYIATQGPLTETAADFWIMVWMQNSQNIVMLTALKEKGHEMCARYWPDEVEEEKTFGDITVRYVGKDDDDVVDYTVREFVVSNTAHDEEERNVRQFHYQGWPEVGLPSDAHGMIEIANRLTSKDKQGYFRPTVVHCSSGGGRTGVFIALNILMEQADNDGLVDVFQTVKSLRAQRPHIIQTQEQFYFCYVALLQYLETNQLAGDNTTLTSNINSSVGNPSDSVYPSNGAVPVSAFLGVENTTPRGSMNNKLDAQSINDAESTLDSKKSASNASDGVEAKVETQKNRSNESVNDAMLNTVISSDGNGTSNESGSEFEIVSETDQDNIVNV